jgi:pyruvate kinase
MIGADAMDRRTRIVATLGPATEGPQVLERLLTAGVDVVRINFSHSEPEEHERRIASVRKAAERLQKPVAVLADLPGPKLRVRLSAAIELAAGSELSLACATEVAADLIVTEPECVAEAQAGQRILLDDGRMQLVVLRRDGPRLVARVTVGGTLQPNKGLNLPDTPLSIPTLTERDRQALRIAARAGVDWIALSFVRRAAAAGELRKEAKALGLNVPILAKIERPEAVEHAEEIVAAFDAVMVARGDLGVEIPLERVPTVQKRLIQMARRAGKPVITATDMLDSMRQNPRPTRAEASDVANAIFDGTDAVMLSGETAIGSYPIEAVACMDRIAREVEPLIADDPRYHLSLPVGPIDDQITQETCQLAHDIKADAIITPTNSGRTARLVARHRPAATIVAPAPTDEVVRQISLIWGVRAVRLDSPLPRGADRLEAAIRSAFAAGAVTAGQIVVVLAGHPNEGGSRFPTIRVARVGPDGHSQEPQT